MGILVSSSMICISATLLYIPHYKIETSLSRNFNVGSTLFWRCGSTLKQHWSDIENETKSDVGFSKSHNVDKTSVFDV